MSGHPTPLGGTCSARFDPLRELFAAKLESGEDLGASVAVNIDGETVVDQQAYVWVRYGGIERLRPPLRRDSFRELGLTEGRVAGEPRPLGEPAWAKMHHTGLVFVEEPRAQDGV
jgi:hypothetical protein